MLRLCSISETTPQDLLKNYELVYQDVAVVFEEETEKVPSHVWHRSKGLYQSSLTSDQSLGHNPNFNR